MWFKGVFLAAVVDSEEFNVPDYPAPVVLVMLIRQLG